MGTRVPTVVTGTWNGTAGSGVTFLDNALVTTLGWTITQTATNRRIYRPPAGNRFCLLVDDRGTVPAGGARDLMVRMCEVASTFATLVNPAPTVAQVANNQVSWRKSDTADATTRNVTLVGDDRGFVFWPEIDAAGSVGDMFGFSDAVDGWSGDSYNTFIILRNTSYAFGGLSGQALAQAGQNTMATTSSSSQLTFMRSPDGLVTSVLGGARFTGNTSPNVCGPYPQTDTGKLHQTLIPVTSAHSQTVASTAVMKRGYIPFIFELHAATPGSLVPGDTYTDTAYDAASEFVIASDFVTFIAASSGTWGVQTDGTFDPKAAI